MIHREELNRSASVAPQSRGSGDSELPNCLRSCFHDRSDRKQGNDRDDLTTKDDPVEIDRRPPAHVVSTDQEDADRSDAEAEPRP
jgi:hypothetical protein